MTQNKYDKIQSSTTETKNKNDKTQKVKLQM